MPQYAIVAIVEAPQAEAAWESIGERLLNDDAAQCAFVYVGAPWLVPGNSTPGSIEYGTDAIRLQLNGRCVNLSPAE